MPRPCSKCHRNVDFIAIPGRRGLTCVDYVLALVMVDDGGAWMGWDKRTMAPVHGWVMDRTKPKEEVEAFAKSKGKRLAWVWRPHFLTCAARAQTSPPAAPQASCRPERPAKAPEPVDPQGRLF